MKKIFLVPLLLVSLFATSACNNDSATAPSSETTLNVKQFEITLKKGEHCYLYQIGQYRDHINVFDEGTTIIQYSGGYFTISEQYYYIYSNSIFGYKIVLNKN